MDLLWMVVSSILFISYRFAVDKVRGGYRTGGERYVQTLHKLQLDLKAREAAVFWFLCLIRADVCVWLYAAILHFNVIQKACFRRHFLEEEKVLR